MQVTERAVFEHDAVFTVERAGRGVELAERLVQHVAIGWMDVALEQTAQPEAAGHGAAAENPAQLGRAIVGLGAVEVLDVIAKVGELLRESQFGFAAAQPLVGELAQRDVADEADEPRRLHALHLAHGQLAREYRAVLAARLHFAADADDAGFAGALVPVHVRVVLGAIGRGHQHGDVLPDHLGGGVPEDALGRQAELLDAAAMVDDDDGVDRGIQQGTELQLRFARVAWRGGLGVVNRLGVLGVGQNLSDYGAKVRILKEPASRH